MIEKKLRTKVSWFTRLLGKLGRKYWVQRLGTELYRAYQEGKISSETMHTLDDRMKYNPSK